MPAIPPIPAAVPLYLLAFLLVVGTVFLVLPWLRAGTIGRTLDLSAWFFADDELLNPEDPDGEPAPPEVDHPPTD